MHSRRSFWPTLIPVILLVASCASVGQETTRRVASDVTEGTLYNFQFGSDGARPYAGMVFDASGNLYGTTQFGGISHSYGGTVFKLSPDGNGGWTERVLHTFQGYFDGQQPVSAVAVDSHGNVFGTTPVGGIYNFGTVYQLIPRQGGYEFETTYTITGGSDRGATYWPPSVHAGCNVYRTTNSGGAQSYGTCDQVTSR